MFAYARSHLPCIIFIDEIDAIGSRKTSFERSHPNQTVNELLCQLDGLVSSSGILCIGATNHPKMLDEAFRVGRFDKTIAFDYPNFNERKEMFKLYLPKIKLHKSLLPYIIETDENNNSKVVENPKYNDLVCKLAERTTKNTGAVIKTVCNQAILNHMKKYDLREIETVDVSAKDNTKAKNKDKTTNKLIKKKVILVKKNITENTTENKDENEDITHDGCNENDLLEAIDDVNIGIVKRERTMNDAEKRQTAYHESGHALVGCLLDGGSIPIKMSIIPRGEDALGFTQPDIKDKYMYFKRELLAEICVLLGGRIAEELFCDDISAGASDDFEKASKLAVRFVSDFSMVGKINLTSDKHNSEKYKAEVDDEATSLLNECRKYVITLLSQDVHKKILEQFTQDLLKKEILCSDDMKQILQSYSVEHNKIVLKLTNGIITSYV